jgi:hypothetical protein
VARRSSALDGHDAVDVAVAEIERYVRAHPHASDTLHGVRDWWLAGLGQVLPLSVVQTALDRLVAAGRIVARRIPGDVVYGSAAQGDVE